VKIAGFVRYALGEGIDKQESDFAAEVAAASGQKKTAGRFHDGAVSRIAARIKESESHHGWSRSIVVGDQSSRANISPARNPSASIIQPSTGSPGDLIAARQLGAEIAVVVGAETSFAAWKYHRAASPVRPAIPWACSPP